MSNRGSFVTEYIYCDQCFESAKAVLLKRDKGLCSVIVPHWSSDLFETPIIAGKIGSMHSEADEMEQEICPELAKVICHTMRIAVLGEGIGQARTLFVEPIATHNAQ